MWKGVVLFDTPAANFQGRRSLLWNSVRHAQTRISPAGITYPSRRVYNGDCSNDNYAHIPSSSPAIHVFPLGMDDAMISHCFLLNGWYRYSSRCYTTSKTVTAHIEPMSCYGSKKESVLLLTIPGPNRLYCSGPKKEKGNGFPECSTDGRHRWTANGTYGKGKGVGFVASVYNDGTAFHGTGSTFSQRGISGYRWHRASAPFTGIYGMGVGAPSRRCFSFWGGGPGKKDINKTGGGGGAPAPSSKGGGIFGISKRHGSSRSLVRLSFGVVRWVVVLPFRLGKWAFHFFSLTFRMVGHLMRLSARAAVVARVSGVSGIFKSIIDGVKHTVHWCKTGFRLYFANVKVSYYILLKRLKGHPMRYNERKLLMKTLNDALKMLPFSFFIIVPFAEFLLPVAIRLFPQMLPSTFRTDNSKSDDYLQKKLLAKKELAQFFQELVQERTNQILQEELDSSLKTKMEALKDFQERILNKEDLDINPFLSCNELLVFSKIFKKEFRLDQMNLETLKVMCKLLGITPFSMRTHVVLQLRHHLLKIQREDRLILWEGVDSLSTEELQEACRDRAMKFYNVTKEQLQQQLKQWLDLSSMPEISPILLLWSRCITMTHEPMAIKADEEVKTEEVDPAKDATLETKEEPTDKQAHESGKTAKMAEKFAEEVTTAQKASSRPIVQAVTAAAEVDAQKLLNREERLEELSLKAEELKGIIQGNIQETTDEEIVDGATSFDDPKPEELMMEMYSNEEKFMQLNHGEHVILHTHEINKLGPLSKQEILIRHEELLSALHLQRQISDLQHNQLTELFMFLLKVSEETNAGKVIDFKDNINDLVKAARLEMEKIEELTYQFDKHNLTYE